MKNKTIKILSFLILGFFSLSFLFSGQVVLASDSDNLQDILAEQADDDGSGSTSSGTTSASNSLSETCRKAGQSNNPLCQTNTRSSESLIADAIRILMYVVAVASVVFIIVGGIKYALSSGKPDAVSKAKNTVLGAVFGLVIALFALLIVDFVMKAVDGSGGGQSSSSGSEEATTSTTIRRPSTALPDKD